MKTPQNLWIKNILIHFDHFFLFLSYSFNKEKIVSLTYKEEHRSGKIVSFFRPEVFGRYFSAKTNLSVITDKSYLFINFISYIE